MVCYMKGRVSVEGVWAEGAEADILKGKVITLQDWCGPEGG